MTTRKKNPRPFPPAILTALTCVVLLSGCATPGPLHLYVPSPTTPTVIRDVALDSTSASPADIPSFLAADDTLIGFAYDPFTDHFFLRLAPGDRFRVVDRPARAIKREFTVASLATTAPHRGGDLAIRPRDGHVFAAHPTQPAVVEFNRFGNFVRTLPLATLNAPPAALAFDPTRDRLLALSGGDLARITTHDLSGQRLSSVSLDRDVASAALAYDPEKREFYAPLLREPALGIFDESGHLVRTLPVPNPASTRSVPASAHFDLGPRSFLRLF
jgi:hypothetical protein